jgi:hypothetical protein
MVHGHPLSGRDQLDLGSFDSHRDIGIVTVEHPQADWTQSSCSVLPRKSLSSMLVMLGRLASSLSTAPTGQVAICVVASGRTESTGGFACDSEFQ